jgi:aspartate kinase
MTLSSEHNIAKFGGTSMAAPEAVLEQLSYPQNDAQVVVVSAPGKDSHYDEKVTDMLLSYAEAPSSTVASKIQQRYDQIADRLASPTTKSLLDKLVQAIPVELDQWQCNAAPVEALGEYWSARLFALVSGRTFLDARDVILFDTTGAIDLHATGTAYVNHVDPQKRYVMPGFYGSDPRGIKTFERGGSDISGAVLAFVSNAANYYNWSDVPGLMSANPKIVEDARLLSEVTYREARELANGGSELLHRTAIKLLGHSDVVTNLRNTFGAPEQTGTSIARERNWQSSPLVGVTGQSDLVELSLHEFGLKEEVGGTIDVYEELGRNRVPYEHTSTATDDVSIFIEGQHEQEVRHIAETLQNPGRELRVRLAGMVHVVGEGLVKSGTERMRVLGAVATAFANADIEGMGATDVAGSAAITIFVKPESTHEAIREAHRALDMQTGRSI